MLGNGGTHIKVGNKGVHIVGYLKRFYFTTSKSKFPHYQADNKIACCWQRYRKPSDVMILDEPTNDLDMDTLDLLEDMLAEYKGTLLIVSHDRDFVGRLCSALLVCEGAGKIVK